MEGGLGFLFLRTRLHQEIYNERVNESFVETLDALKEMNTNVNKFMYEVMLLAKVEIENKNLKIAAYDVNLLHNLPETKFDSWNEEYFFNVELLGYLEHMSDFKRIDKIKKMIQLVSMYLIEEK